jgi:hypothetical protein
VPGSNADGTAFTLIGYVQQLSDRKLYYFLTQTNQFPNSELALTMYNSEPDGVTNRTQLRSDSYVVEEVLWALDGSGAVIKDAANASPTGDPRRSLPLHWLKTDGSPTFDLPAAGFNLRWGKP